MNTENIQEKDRWDAFKHAMNQLGETHCKSPAEFIGLICLYIWSSIYQVGMDIIVTYK